MAFTSDESGFPLPPFLNKDAGGRDVVGNYAKADTV